MKPVFALLGSLFIVSVGLLPSLAQDGEGKGKPRPQKWIGQLSKVEGKKLTVTRRGDSGEASETFTTDKETKIRTETDQDEKFKIKGEGGEREITRPKTVDAKLADLKVGQRISVTFTPDKKAMEVLGMRAVKQRKEGEGK